MCTKWHVWLYPCSNHASFLFLPCWYKIAPYSFAVHYLWQHWFWRAGNRGFITECPNSFVQDCRIQRFINNSRSVWPTENLQYTNIMHINPTQSLNLHHLWNTQNEAKQVMKICSFFTLFCPNFSSAHSIEMLL